MANQSKINLSELDKETRAQLENLAKLKEKVTHDMAFRAELIAHPREILKQFGIILPENKEIKVVELKEGEKVPEDTNKTLYIPLRSASHKLSEEELGEAAGGITTLIYYGLEALANIKRGKPLDTITSDTGLKGELGAFKFVKSLFS